MDWAAGVTRIEIRLAGTTVNVAVSLNAPTVALMVAVPAATVDTRPVLSTVATEGVEELQVTALVRSCDEPSVYVAVATYCWRTPIPRVSPTGVTEMDVITGAFTARLVELLIAPKVAEMFVVPAATPVASPLASIVAIPTADDVQLTSAVRSRLLPSL